MKIFKIVQACKYEIQGDRKKMFQKKAFHDLSHLLKKRAKVLSLTN